MNPADILIALRADGFVLTAEGDRIRIEPGDRLTDNGLSLIRANKPALLELLRTADKLTLSVELIDIDREAFEERAGILEYDGGCSRPEAELLAAWEATQALFSRLTAREWPAR